MRMKLDRRAKQLYNNGNGFHQQLMGGEYFRAFGAKTESRIEE